MNDLIKTIEKNKSLVIFVLAVLMFSFFAISAVDIAGKAQAGGFTVVFDGKGLGFSRILSIIILVIPVLIVLNRFVDLKLSGKLKEDFNFVCFAIGLVCCIFMAIILPELISLAWGGWLYIILATAGVAVTRIETIKK